MTDFAFNNITNIKIQKNQGIPSSYRSVKVGSITELAREMLSSDDSPTTCDSVVYTAAAHFMMYTLPSNEEVTSAVATLGTSAVGGTHSLYIRIRLKV